jgi:protein phosphatase
VQTARLPCARCTDILLGGNVLALRRHSYALTDVGRRRSQNEDAFLADDTLGLYAVADGVGGNAKGEVASAESVEQLRNFVSSGYGGIDAYLRAARGTDEQEFQRRLMLRRLLESAVQSACYFVFGMAEQDPEGQGMSTTLSSVLLVGHLAFIAQVGDSRVYHFRGGAAAQVTDDHTLVNHQLRQGLVTPEEARSMKGHNVITRAVGHRDYVEVDTFEIEALAGDRFLVCSDGLHGYLRPGEVEELLGSGHTIESSARRAVELANERGGKDNVTAVVVAVS